MAHWFLPIFKNFSAFYASESTSASQIAAPQLMPMISHMGVGLWLICAKQEEIKLVVFGMMKAHDKHLLQSTAVMLLREPTVTAKNESESAATLANFLPLGIDVTTSLLPSCASSK